MPNPNQIEKQVVSLPFSMLMDNLGFDLEAMFHWKPAKGKHICHSESKPHHKHDYRFQLSAEAHNKDQGSQKYFALLRKEKLLFKAYTVGELGMILPAGCWSGPVDDGFGCGFDEEHDYGNIGILLAETEADARAKMAIHLRQNKLI